MSNYYTEKTIYEISETIIPDEEPIYVLMTGADVGPDEQYEAGFVPASVDELFNKRTFYIVRIHNGAATKLSAFVDGDNIEFDSDSFSSYALVYNDTFSDPNTGEMYVNNKSVKQCLFIFPSLIIVTIGFWIKYIRRKQTK